MMFKKDKKGNYVVNSFQQLLELQKKMKETEETSAVKKTDKPKDKNK